MFIANNQHVTLSVMRTSLLNKRPRFNATLTTTMHPRKRYLLDPGFSDIRILKEVGRSDASSIFEIELDGERYAMKLVSIEPLSLIVAHISVS